MKIWYTARNIFNKAHDGWKEYVNFSGLTQTEEIVSLDCSLNEPTFEFESKNPKDWEFGITSENQHFTDCYTSLEYVISKVKDKSEYNLLALCFRPTYSCNNFHIENFTFVGYDLLDQSHGNSSLTNCGGSPDIFANSELNKFGLLDNFERAKEIQTKLFALFPQDYHSDTNLWAIWRHDIIGRT